VVRYHTVFARFAATTDLLIKFERQEAPSGKMLARPLLSCEARGSATKARYYTLRLLGTPVAVVPDAALVVTAVLMGGYLPVEIMEEKTESE